MPGNPTKTPGPVRSTRSSAQKPNIGRDQAETSATLPPNNSDSESSHEEPTTMDNTDELREQVERLQAKISRLTQDHSPRPTTKSDPITLRQSHPPGVRFQSETPSLSKVKLSKRTPNIDCLTDGKEPTFRQWQASIKD
ncbi:hypothetical protein EJ02DRAFT_471424 [Clathrospora elynae]|uniref:Uncharacterized protein n=1 Tax=Clathrospora elynae TaxID=706981 RepID=A0A6A5S686_9PLEO|nr:hypothetical protein EJ02DRAFT_471424 [Clathrospora elynae]